MSARRILTFVLIAAVVSAAVYWLTQNPPGVTMIDPARPDSGTSRSGKDPHYLAKAAGILLKLHQSVFHSG